MVTSCWGSLAFRQLFLQRAQPMGLVLSASLSVGVYLLGLFCLISLWPRNHWLRVAFSIGMALSWIILSHFFSSIWAIFYYYYYFSSCRCCPVFVPRDFDVQVVCDFTTSIQLIAKLVNYFWNLQLTSSIGVATRKWNIRFSFILVIHCDFLFLMFDTIHFKIQNYGEKFFFQDSI